MKPKRTSDESFCTRPPSARRASWRTRHRVCAPPDGYLLSAMLPDSSTSKRTVEMIFSNPTLMSLQPGMWPAPPSKWKIGGAVVDPEPPPGGAALEPVPPAADAPAPPPDVSGPPEPGRPPPPAEQATHHALARAKRRVTCRIVCK